MQEGHPESRKLNDTERRYTVQEKEMTFYLRGCIAGELSGTTCWGPSSLSRLIMLPQATSSTKRLGMMN